MPDVQPRLEQVVIDTIDARRAAEFWRRLLELTYRPGDEAPGPGEDDLRGRDWLCLWRTDGVPLLAFQQVPDLRRPTWPDADVPQQLHLDLTVSDVAELEAASTAVLALGGEQILDRSQDPEEPLRVFTDLDGHPFCVFVRFE